MSLAYLLLLLPPVSLFVTLAAHAAVFVALRRREGRPAFTPPISILKPVKGDEPGLYQNLASLAAHDYPAFELCIGAEDAGDAPLSVARQGKAHFPSAP